MSSRDAICKGLLFLFAINLVMWKTVEHAAIGIRWKMTTTLEYEHFADDLAVISRNSHRQERNEFENQHQENQTHENKCK